MNENKFDEAISYLRKAVAKDPAYSMARENLAIALNNKGLDLNQKGSPQGGLQCMESSYFDDPYNETTLYNLEGLIKKLDMNPRSPFDRCNLGGQAILRADWAAAWVEFNAALQNCGFTCFAPKKKPEPEITLHYDGKRDDFYKDYMDLVTKRIKRNWFPPKRDISDKIVVIMNVSRSGLVELDKPLPNTPENNAAIDAIKRSQPLPRLYKNETDLNIKYTFEYNVKDSQGNKY